MTTWNARDGLTFDLSGTLTGDGQTGVVGCKSFPFDLLLRHAESVNVTGRRFSATRIKVPAEAVGDNAVTLSSVRFSAMQLSDYATNITVTPVRPAEAAWQNGDAILVTTDDQGRAGYRRRPQGVYVLKDAGPGDAGRFVHTVQADQQITLYGVKRCVERSGPVSGDFSDLALRDFTVLVRGGKAVQGTGLAVGDRVRIANPAFTTPRDTGYVSSAAYGKEASIIRQSTTEPGLWHVRGDGFTQVIHEKYLTKIA